MTYQRFEDLPVWQKAADLYDLTGKLVGKDAYKITRGFRDQLDRAALSVSNNIAEGFERGTKNELLQFIYIARGSAGEVRSMLCLSLRRAEIERWPMDLKSEISSLIAVAESCSRQLRGWADTLQDSDIKGPRHLNAAVRKENDQKQRMAELDKELIRRLPEWHPKRMEARENGLI